MLPSNNSNIASFNNSSNNLYLASLLRLMSDSMDMSLSKLGELVTDKGSLACCSQWGHKESDTTE